MKQYDVEQLLIDVVREIQELSGRHVAALTGASRPILDMPGFDSLNGVEATVEVIDRLDSQLTFNNVFVENGAALTIQQAAARLLTVLGPSLRDN